MSDHNNKPLYSLTVAEYIELSKRVFSEEVSRLLKNQIEPPKPREESDIIFVDDVLTITGYQKATLYSKVCRFEIPVLSRRKPLTFSKAAILSWLKAGKPSVIEMEASQHIGNTWRKRA
jgi:hypothetical protein